MTLVLMLGFSPRALASLNIQNWPTTSSGTDISAALMQVSSSFEPSGLAWHPGRQQLLAVGDEGELAAFNTDGSDVTLWQPGGDLEDVTLVNSSSSLVYLADENGRILAYDLSTSRITQSWDVTEWMPPSNGNGMEGLTYANGYFYAGYQADGKIYVLNLSGSQATLVRTLDVLSGSGYTDLAALHYANETLYAVYDSGDLLVEMDLEGNIQAIYSLPGSNQEGLALGEDGNQDGDANFYLAQDSGGILSYDGFPVPTASTVLDEDGDGAPFENDCNDNDATVSSEQTYYLDRDADGLGSSRSALFCASTAPTGYSSNSNDTHDRIPNAGIEIDGDETDNDGDGLIDEVNTLAENGAHPYYSTLNVHRDGSRKIIEYSGLENGHILVRYKDNSVYDYAALNVSSSTPTTVSLKQGTAYLIVRLGQQRVVLSGYTGQAK
ncbi:SdiA-regulated domain-containing protein [Candidatus Peregrinibacteria bacterium]|nr:MAG: SdiA-regulated domain-containing protein [Candidatus Peregrinibacteria bacterium]